MTYVVATYYASKVGGMIHVINGGYIFASFTTKVLLLDLQRSTKSGHFPLSKAFNQWKSAAAKVYPGYIRETAKALRNSELEILPSQSWDLTRISVRTFAYCIADWNKGPNLLDALQAAGIDYMHQLSNWFSATNGEAPVVAAISNRVQNKLFSLPVDELIDEIEGIEGFGNLRTALIKAMVKSGVISLLADSRNFALIRLADRKKPDWQRRKFTLFGEPTLERGRLYSDGSFKVNAAFAVIDSGQNEWARSKIVGLQTPQRAELFGLLVATFLGPNQTIHADPSNIISTIKKAIGGKIRDYEWPKVANRSIIRNIAHIAFEGNNYVWIRGHQDGEESEEAICNNVVDAVAKDTERNDSIALVGECWEFADEYMVLDKGSLFEGDVRKVTLKRLEEKDQRAFLEDSKRIRFANKGWWFETPDKAAVITHGAFRLKLYSKSLPTHDRLMKRYPGLYAGLLCPCCEKTFESDWHLLVECSAFLNDKMEVWEEIVECLGANIPGGNDTVLREVPNWLTNSQGGKENPATFWFLGGIPSQTLDFLKTYLSRGELYELWQTVHARVMKLAQTMWKARCLQNKNKGWVFGKLWNDHIEETIFEEYTQTSEADDYIFWGVDEPLQ